MLLYNNFIGLDIGKLNFVVAVNGEKETKEYNNSTRGIKEFIKDYKNIFGQSLCILENTGGYELELLYTLCGQKIAVHRADARKVKNFIRSYGNSAKTDKLDTKVLAKYGAERKDLLKLFTPLSKQALNLFELVRRRQDLKQILVAEKNRLQAPSAAIIKLSCKQIIKSITHQIEAITEKIKELIDSDPILKQKQEILKTIPGIGNIVAFELLILLPELGSIDRRKIASLSGLAPMSNDSGKHQGYRKTYYGRNGIKPVLFLAAMAARNSKSEFRNFYKNLIARGEIKMVAFAALMRKIIVIANARLRDFYAQIAIIK